MGDLWKALSRTFAGLAAAELALGPPALAAGDSGATPPTESRARPPPRGQSYLQYGVAFTVEGVAAPGPICSEAVNPCILGSGAGITIRVGWRPTEDFYIGGAYEFSKQDPNKLYRLGILQQARGELRHYFPNGRSTAPFALVGLGLATYGNEWTVDTWGPAAALGGGVEVELSGKVALGVSLGYRPVYLHAFVDSSTLSHESGIAHFVGLELALEAQDAL
jgi:hypothetical protein